eukprot:TRINITY_DN8709_c0_g1_i1.p1 TRINITY_DN8709_c0_g1~~TRINITY_DN8709_c0_g1_i1.p1  ORF type:complete len:358 (-),score=70.48 TRINITY_DN8709_c0_g1_i1:262-1335(-)
MSNFFYFLLSLFQCVHFSIAVVSSAKFKTLVFEDNFDELDVKKWEHEITAGGGGNWEFQHYVNNRSNSFVENGVLYMRPTLTADKVGEEHMDRDYNLDLWGGAGPATECTSNQFWGCFRSAGAGGNVLPPIQSARLRTANSFSFKYGHIQVRAKIPKGDWLWPAIWLLPRWNYYGDWPSSGEIDIMETHGNGNGYPDGIDSFGSTIHMGPYWQEDDWPNNHGAFQLKAGEFSDDFHIFGLVWDENGMYTYVDTEDQKVLDIKFDIPFWQKGGWDKTTYDNPWKGRPLAAPFDQEFFLIFNVAVGGTGKFFPDAVGGKPWLNIDPHAVNAFWKAKDKWFPTWEFPKCAMQIDYVRVWQ